MSGSTCYVINESLDLLRRAATGISDANREAATPCREWTVTQVLQHAVADQLAWAASLGVGTGPSENPFTPSGHLQGSVEDLVEPALATAHRAWSAVRVGESVPTPLPQGSLTAAAAAAACALDAAVHAWDIAVAVRRNGPLSVPLAGELLPTARTIVEPLRQFGAYAPALTPHSGDDEVAELLRYLGRSPEWTTGA